MNNSGVVTWVCEYLVMTKDESKRLKIDDVMDAYTTWCEERRLSTATRTMVGHVVKKFFNPTVRLTTKDKRRKYSYEGMMFREDVGEIPEMELLTHEEHVAIRMLGAVMDVQVKTNYVMDGNDVLVLVSLNTATGSMGINVGGKLITQEFMIRNGIYGLDTMSQKFIDGITRIVSKMKLCMGKPFEVTDESTIPEQHVWVIKTGLHDPEMLRLHSKHCEKLLSLSTNYETYCCGHCVHDLGQLIRRTKSNEEKRLQQEEQDALAGPSAVTADQDQGAVGGEPSLGDAPSGEDDEDDYLDAVIKVEPAGAYDFLWEDVQVKQKHVSEGLCLCTQDERDMLVILKKLMKDCPNFKILLENQLRNAQHDDSRANRWDPSIISWCLNMWAKSPNAYSDFRGGGFIKMPSQRLLRYHKNKIKQETGINHENLAWMMAEAKKFGEDVNIWHGMLLLDEMSIQQDLQISKRKDKWEIVGAVDLGPLANNLHEMTTHKKGGELQMASHCFQYLFVSFGGFRWPVAYYGSHNVNGHSIFLTFWEIVNTLRTYGFYVHTALMDGSSNNRQFMRLMISSENARSCRYSTVNPYDVGSKVVMMQDIKHVFKKIRNSILTSSIDCTAKRSLRLKGKNILWSHFVGAMEFNTKNSFRIYRRLTKEHICLNAQLKMRNHLAMDVLNKDMLNLMQLYQKNCENPSDLDSTVLLLQNTSIMVDIFSDINSKIENIYDRKINQLTQVLEFFHDWEKEHTTPKEQAKHLITRETRQDVDSSLYGFIELVKTTSNMRVALVPGYINSDTIENYFCQQRGLRNGFNQNPTLQQIGPATNANLITGSVISRKSNTGGSGRQFKGVLPPSKKFRTD